MMCLRNLLQWRPHQGAVAFTMGTMSLGLLHSILMFYYVKIFLDMYHVPESWFQATHALYMVWNAINDPLFGYIQDNYNWPIFRKRRLVIYYGGPFFALSFMMFWIPWQNYQPGNWLSGLHLLIALCLYDSMFTIIGLGFCCLMTEMSQSHEDRLRMVQYSRISHIAGSLGIFFCEKTSNGLKSFRSFQLACAALSVLAVLLFAYTGKHAHTAYEKNTIESGKEACDTPLPVTDRDSGLSMLRLTWQVLRQWNFVFFVISNFWAEYHRNFMANFVRIFCENLIPNNVLSPEGRKWFYGIIFIIPQVLVVLGTPFMARIGYYKVFKLTFVFKMVFAGIMYFIGPDYPVAYMVFIVLDCIFGTLAADLMGLPLADIVDENMDMYGQKHPMSSTVFGTNALVTKPAQSLSPMITVRVLNAYGYESLAQHKGPTPKGLRDAMFGLSCFTPLVLGAMQYAVWTRYKIKDSHEKGIPK